MNNDYPICVFPLRVKNKATLVKLGRNYVCNLLLHQQLKGNIISDKSDKLGQVEDHD